MPKEIKNYILTAYKKQDPQSFIKEWQFKIERRNDEVEEIDVPTFMQIIQENTGISNLDMVWFKYDDLEKELYKDDYAAKDLPFIKPGTTLEFPIKDSPLIIEEIAKNDQFLKQTSFQSYWSENLKKLIKDPLFVPDNIVAADSSMSIKTRVQSMNIRVWIYCKSIDTVLDVSQYIISCSTDKAPQSGGFTIVLAPFKDATNKNTFGASYWDVVNTVTAEGNAYRSYLEKVVQPNDIVFIRFERLKLEKSRDSEIADNIFVSPNNLANTGTNYNVWDMIGFVDNCNEVYSAEDNVKTTIISGRDVSKLFEEDGSYFIPLIDIEESKQRWSYLGSPGDSWYKRNVLTGSYDYLWSYKYKAINEVIWFIINIMSNIGVCKDDLFKGWGDKRLSSYSVEGQEDLQVKGVWQIVKTYIDDASKQRIVVDSSIGNPNGTLMSYMNRVCQYPFVEFMFDTYINTIDIIVRQPPFTKAAIEGAFKNGDYITITPDNLINYNLSYDQRVYSWFQIHIQNNQLVGDTQQTNLAFVPIVYLNEYAELWGNRKLEVNDMYTQWKTNYGQESKPQFTTVQAALLNDLIYLVESNAYLPFTRMGSIEINGDRRIKAGTFILNEATDEFFYVLSVSNTMAFSAGGIERRTTLQVERGMYVPILEGTDTKSKKRLDNTEPSVTGSPSYFDIVDLSDLRSAAKQAEGGSLTTAQSPAIKRDQFEYFLNRKMFGGLK